MKKQREPKPQLTDITSAVPTLCCLRNYHLPKYSIVLLTPHGTLCLYQHFL